MKRKSFYIMSILMFVSIFYLHYHLNYREAIKAPSEVWAKEVLISKGDIKQYPALTGYNDNYIVVHQNGDDIKAIVVDKLGNILKESTFKADGKEPRDLGVVTDNKNIYITYMLTDMYYNTVKILKLNDNLELIETKQIDNMRSKLDLSENILCIFYDDHIEFIDFLKSSSFKINLNNKAEMPTSIPYKDKYLITYISDRSAYKYFFIDKNGQTTEPKVAFDVQGGSNSSFISNTITYKENDIYAIVEYVYKGKEYTVKSFKFSLDKNDLYISDFRLMENFGDNIDERKKFNVDVTSLANYPNQEGMILGSCGRKVFKMKEQPDIVEISIEDNENSIGGRFRDKYGAVIKNPVSNSRNNSIYPVSYKSAIVFCEPIGNDKSNVYITSKDKEFKEVNNKSRPSEAIDSLLATSESMLFGMAYLVIYGSLWIIPSLALISLISIIEFKFNKTIRKALFIFAYSLAYLLKLYFINKLFYINQAMLMPSFFSLNVGVACTLLISLVCLSYGYKDYSKDLDYNVIVLSFSKPILIDSLLTLILFVGFII
ncbi:hypothetical protein [Clostridium sp. UBA6640]|uniref:hypothetical protein n=1 Tax=Clostridium sp. UBA6640 TaxID=1946370 RepID=UPI0025C69291|nr:hypothetical protein [Clostridium sp. UBA6640]